MKVTHPQLRHPIDIRHEHLGNEAFLLLRCPLGITKEPLGLIPDVIPVLNCFNGSLSIEEIARKLKPQGATEEIVRQLADLLNEHYFLQTPRFLEKAHELKKSFKDSPERPAALAGACYSSDSEGLQEELKGYLSSSEQPQRQGELIGISAPHIDYQRGSLCYGKTYAHLEQSPHDLYLLMGTSHQYSDHIFHFTDKHFQTPLGVIECDRDFMNDLAGGYGIERAFADEYLHKQEHSLELQVPFLQYHAPQSKIAPILIGSFYNFLREEKAPTEFEVYESLAENLTRLIRERKDAGQRLCIVAGVDMAHIGRAFGDQFSLTPEVMDKIRERDELYIKSILDQDKEQLYAHIAQDGDARRICGYPTMYLMLDVLKRADISYDTTLYEYRQAVDYTKECAVTFAGIGFYL